MRTVKIKTQAELGYKTIMINSATWKNIDSIRDYLQETTGYRIPKTAVIRKALKVYAEVLGIEIEEAQP